MQSSHFRDSGTSLLDPPESGLSAVGCWPIFKKVAIHVTAMMSGAVGIVAIMMEAPVEGRDFPGSLPELRDAYPRRAATRTTLAIRPRRVIVAVTWIATFKNSGLERRFASDAQNRREWYDQVSGRGREICPCPRWRFRGVGRTQPRSIQKCGIAGSTDRGARSCLRFRDREDRFCKWVLRWILASGQSAPVRDEHARTVCDPVL